MEGKTCSLCGTEKLIKIFKIKYADCKDSKSKCVLKRYYDNKDNLSNQQKISYEKNNDETLQQQKDKHILSKELIRTYVEIDNRLKALEEKAINFCSKI